MKENYAVIESGGKQYTVSPGDTIFVEKLEGEAGEKVTFSNVLLVKAGSDAELKLGNPLVEKSKVSGKIVRNAKDRKVDVFKKKRRQGYKRLRGHRQWHTQVEIESIA